MCALWSKTRAAINHGYGMNVYKGSPLPEIGLPDPYYKPRPWGIPSNPLFDDTFDIANVRKQMQHGLSKHTPRGGAKFAKGSPEAKAYMAKLRAMRGTNKHGGKSLLHRKMKGGNFFTDLFKDLGETGLGTLKALAAQGHTSVSELLKNPSKLIALATAAGPAVLAIIKKLFGIDKKQQKAKEEEEELKKAEKERKMLAYLKYLKKTNPKAYKKAYAKYQYMKEKEMMKDSGFDVLDAEINDIGDISDDDDNTISNDNENNENTNNKKKKAIEAFSYF